jgi:putative membrane protein
MGLELPVFTPENYDSVLSSIPDLSFVKKQLDDAVQFTQGLIGYTSGVAQLGQGASDLAGGTAEFNSSSSVIAASANELYNAGAELNMAVKQLRDGLASYKGGTKQLRDGTSDMDSEIKSRIDDILDGISGGDSKIVSFVSDKNTNISAVQFVLKTDPVSCPEPQEDDVPEPVRLTFWQRLLELFGL